jgi:hypothetical protein
MIAYRPDVIEAYKPVIEHLQDTYKRWKKDPGRLTLAETIEQSIISPGGLNETSIPMGLWMSMHVCPRLKISDLDCLSIAEVFAAKELTQLPEECAVQIVKVNK